MNQEIVLRFDEDQLHRILAIQGAREALSADSTQIISTSDETQVLPAHPPVEPWTMNTAEHGMYTCWINPDGDMNWVAEGHLPNPSWRQLFVERR